jgi:hypothetical protein
MENCKTTVYLYIFKNQIHLKMGDKINCRENYSEREFTASIIYKTLK